MSHRVFTYPRDRVSDVKGMVHDAGCRFVLLDNGEYEIAHIAGLLEQTLCGRSPSAGGFIITTVSDRVVCVRCLKSLQVMRERKCTTEPR